MKPARHAGTRWSTLARDVVGQTRARPSASRIEIIHFPLLNRYAREPIESMRCDALAREFASIPI